MMMEPSSNRYVINLSRLRKRIKIRGISIFRLMMRQKKHLVSKRYQTNTKWWRMTWTSCAKMGFESKSFLIGFKKRKLLFLYRRGYSNRFGWSSRCFWESRLSVSWPNPLDNLIPSPLNPLMISTLDTLLERLAWDRSEVIKCLAMIKITFRTP